MEKVLLAAVDRRSFFDTDFSCEAAVERLNQYLEFDGLEIWPTGKKFKVVKKVDVDIDVPTRTMARRSSRTYSSLNKLKNATES